MGNIERSIDTLGYQIRDKYNTDKIVARVYALPNPNKKSRYVLYSLNTYWRFGDDKLPIKAIGVADSSQEADEALQNYLARQQIANL